MKLIPATDRNNRPVHINADLIIRVEEQDHALSHKVYVTHGASWIEYYITPETATTLLK